MFFPGSTVLSRRKFSAAFLVRRQNGQVMCQADLIADVSKLAQGIGILPQLLSVNEADGVDYKMGMDMLCIAMGGHLHFISRPSFFSKLSGDLMRLLGCDILPGMEGLNILVEINAIRFVIGSFRCQKFRDGIAAITVDSAD